MDTCCYLRPVSPGFGWVESDSSEGSAVMERGSSSKETSLSLEEDPFVVLTSRFFLDSFGWERKFRIENHREKKYTIANLWKRRSFKWDGKL